MPVPIFTYTTHEVARKVLAQEDDDGFYHFRVGSDDFRVHLLGRFHATAQLVIFDGFLPPDALPRGARELSYEYHLHDRRGWDTSSPITELLLEKESTVRQEGTYVPPFLRYSERMDYTYSKEVAVRPMRYLLALPFGHTALGIRIRPRSLARVYTAIESEKTRVTFRTLVK